MIQKTPSLGSPMGIVTFVLGTALSVFVLTQWDRTRKLLGIPTKGMF